MKTETHPKKIIKENTEKIIEELQLQIDKAKSNLEKLKFNWKVYVGFSLIVFFVGIFLATFEKNLLSELWYWIALIIISIIVGNSGYFLQYLMAQYYQKLIIKNLESKALKLSTDYLQDTLEYDFFNKLVKINFKYIDKYYDQTQNQADKSFNLSLIVAFLAFIIIIFGIVLMIQNKAEAGKIVTASGVLSEFISAVFFYLYNKTITKMSEYHQKLVLTQNIGLALKIVETLPDNEKIGAKAELVKNLTDSVNKYLVQSPSKNIK